MGKKKKDADLQSVYEDLINARTALLRISNWNEHDSGLALDYGSNGVRDYYRSIATMALTELDKKH